jgi:hypothetical protein
MQLEPARRRRQARQHHGLALGSRMVEERPRVPFAADAHRREHRFGRGILGQRQQPIDQRRGDARTLRGRQRIAPGDHFTSQLGLLNHAARSSPATARA